MADKKKMSVAEMLAAARKVDGGAAGAEPVQAAPAAEESSSASGLPSMELPADSSEVVPASSPESATKPKSTTGAGGARPSVAEMMAMARANKGEVAPAAKAPAEKPATTPKPKPAAAATKPVTAAASPAVPRDTASILAAARKKERPGPMTKAEAAAKADASAAVAKPKVVAPPMPLKPDYAKAKPVLVAAAKAGDENRRDFFSLALAVGFWMLGAVSAFWTLLSVKFMFPNVLREPPSKFKVGPPDAFAPGQVQEKFKAQYGIWVVNSEYNGQQQIVALKSVCTHLGCTPNWLEAEQKYKCPCHGSGFYKDGINFEGPAPRPLERYAIRLADDGQIEVDKSRTFQEEMGAWSDPSCFIPV